MEEIAELENDEDAIDELKGNVVAKEAIEKQIIKAEKDLNKLLEEQDNKKVHLINCQTLQQQLTNITTKLENNHELLLNNDKNEDKTKCCQTIEDKLDELLTYNKEQIKKEVTINEEKIKDKSKEKEELTKSIKDSFDFNQNLGDFTIDKITIVKDFIDDNLKSQIINNIKKDYPDTQINEDYTIEIDSLNNYDIVQGKELVIKIKPTKNSKIKQQIIFKSKIEYQYDIDEQRKGAIAILKPAIPHEF